MLSAPAPLSMPRPQRQHLLWTDFVGFGHFSSLATSRCDFNVCFFYRKCGYWLLYVLICQEARPIQIRKQNPGCLSIFCFIGGFISDSDGETGYSRQSSFAGLNFALPSILQRERLQRGVQYTCSYVGDSTLVQTYCIVLLGMQQTMCILNKHLAFQSAQA